MRRIFHKTGQSRFSRAIVHILLITTATSFRLISPLGHQPAQAEEAPQSVIQQHWELLSEAHLGLLGPSTIPIHRGVIPGGTSKFNPEPTAKFVIVARASTGLGHWEVELLDKSGGVIAEIILSETAITSEYQIFSASFAWPSTDRELADIFAHNGGTKSLDIQKAYLKIEQQGIIKKTVARMPVAVRQNAILATSWTDVADPIFYQHFANAFDPAPAISLRTTGRTPSDCIRLDARIVDSSGDPASTEDWAYYHEGSDWTSTKTPVQLVEPKTYHLQVEKSGVCWGTEWLSLPDLLSGDLVFEQSTDDPHGIIRTVGFYPSVSSPTQIDMTGSHLGYLLHAPANQVMSEQAVFDVSMKRVVGSTDAGVSLIYADSGEVLATSVTSSDDWTYLAASLSVLPTAGAVIDTSSIVAESVTGRVSQTVMRALLTLRDLIGIVSGYLENGIVFQCRLENEMLVTTTVIGDREIQGRTKTTCVFPEDPDTQPTEMEVQATLHDATDVVIGSEGTRCHVIEDDPCTEAGVETFAPPTSEGCGDDRCIQYWTGGDHYVRFPYPIAWAQWDGTSDRGGCRGDTPQIGQTYLDCWTKTWITE